MVSLDTSMVTSPQLSTPWRHHRHLVRALYGVVGRDEGELRRCGVSVMVCVAEAVASIVVAVKVRTIT